MNRSRQCRNRYLKIASQIRERLTTALGGRRSCGADPVFRGRPATGSAGASPSRALEKRNALSALLQGEEVEV
jgi:hypothetical protein